MSDHRAPCASLTRRDVLRAAALGSAAAALTDIPPASQALAATAAPHHSATLEGQHQAGIATRQQDHVVFAAVDLTTSNYAALRTLMKDWTRNARHLARGRPVGATETGQKGVGPPDNGEALGLNPAGLTITVGFGPGLFASRRFGLASSRPSQLAKLPAFSTDQLDPVWCDGDLMIQACSDDAQVALHAVRALLHTGEASTSLRWMQSGFVSRPHPSATPRNLLGFKDGTASIDGHDTAALRKFVWAGHEAPHWLHGGTYCVVRRIGFKAGRWDLDGIHNQEDTFGRRKDSGAPLGAHHEHDPLPLSKRDSHGNLVIPVDAHVRLASPQNNGGVHLLRRPYNYTMSSVNGSIDMGLLFLAFQRDLNKGFIAIQQKLATLDALNKYLKPVGSAVFAVPPGLRSSTDYWGSALLR